MPCGGGFPSRRHAGSPITFLRTRRRSSPALTWPASTAWPMNWRTRRFLLPGSALDRDRPRRQSAALRSRAAFAQHKGAHGWWEETVNSSAEIGLTSPAIFGFIRIATNPRVLSPPLTVDAATGYYPSGLASPASATSSLARGMLKLPLGSCTVSDPRNLTTDVQLAAFAFEYDADMFSMTPISPAFPACAGAIRWPDRRTSCPRELWACVRGSRRARQRWGACGRMVDTVPTPQPDDYPASWSRHSERVGGCQAGLDRAAHRVPFAVPDLRRATGAYPAGHLCGAGILGVDRSAAGGSHRRHDHSVPDA